MALSVDAAADVLAKHSAKQAGLIDDCHSSDCSSSLPQMSTSDAGEYEAGTTSSAVLLMAAGDAAARDILEIGASYGGGSTMVLAKGAKARGRAVTSLEAMEDKFHFARRFYGSGGVGADLPVSVLFASSIGPDEVPTRKEYYAIRDPRPIKWLISETAIAEQHGFGLFGALLASQERDFGLVFIDGGAFTGPAEWAILEAVGSNVTWVALDDTHGKTTAALLAASRQPRTWEVVYEELNLAGCAVFKAVGYDTTGGKPIGVTQKTGNREKVGWRRTSPHSHFGTDAAMRVRKALAKAVTEEDKAKGARLQMPRNFALLRRRDREERKAEGRGASGDLRIDGKGAGRKRAGSASPLRDDGGDMATSPTSVVQLGTKRGHAKRN